jgi:hypothetical protein
MNEVFHARDQINSPGQRVEDAPPRMTFQVQNANIRSHETLEEQRVGLNPGCVRVDATLDALDPQTIDVARPDGDPVVPRAGRRGICAPTTQNDIITGASSNRVVTDGSSEQVIARAAVETVITEGGKEGVVSPPTDQDVVALPTAQEVISEASL